MKLKLNIEPQQQGSLHSSALVALNRAASCDNLDVALEILRQQFDSSLWLMGRGGHHVWLSAKTAYGPVPSAVIVESSGLTKVLISWNNEGGALETDVIHVDLERDEYAIRNRIIEMLQHQIVNPGDTITVSEVE